MAHDVGPMSSQWFGAVPDSPLIAVVTGKYETLTQCWASVADPTLGQRLLFYSVPACKCSSKYHNVNSNNSICLSLEKQATQHQNIKSVVLDMLCTTEFWTFLNLAGNSVMVLATDRTWLESRVPSLEEI